MNTLLVAMDEDGLIGDGNKLPWHLPGDLRRFRQRTMGKTIIMGRVTWQGLPMKSPYFDGRVNFVVTHDSQKWQTQVSDQADAAYGPHFVTTIELAVSTGRRKFPEYAEEFFIIGGRQIYELALRRNMVDRMFITHVKGKHMGDVYFTQLGSEWVGRVETQADNFEIIEYVRRP